MKPLLLLLLLIYVHFMQLNNLNSSLQEGGSTRGVLSRVP